jgi:hypothetical protein
MNTVFPKPRKRKSVDPAVQDFRSLEIKQRESSIDMIRFAATRQVRRSRKLAGAMTFNDRGGHVASILAAAYRLLDPRRRKNRTERVNLSRMLIVEDESPATKPLVKHDFVDANADNVAFESPLTQSSDPTISELRDMLSMIRAVEMPKTI